MRRFAESQGDVAWLDVRQDESASSLSDRLAVCGKRRVLPEIRNSFLCRIKDRSILNCLRSIWACRFAARFVHFGRAWTHFSPDSCSTFLIRATVFNQPKHSSIRLRFFWLTA